MTVRVQQEDFNAGAEIEALRLAAPGVGAVVSFVGQVRDINISLNDGEAISTLTLEYYPGMTEKSLESIAEQAKQRWKILDALIIHRFGELHPAEQIVLVAVSGAHRKEAFAACEFIMDYLKTEAPFWKKEKTAQGEHWVEARESDDQARARWETGQ